METLMKSITTRFKEYIVSSDFTYKQKRILLEHLLELHSSMEMADNQHRIDKITLEKDVDRLKQSEEEYLDLWTRVL